MITQNNQSVVPAYGRDYKSAKSAIADFLAGKDFEQRFFPVQGGTYVSVTDFAPGVRVNIRYCRQTRVAVATVPLKRYDKETLKQYCADHPAKLEEAAPPHIVVAEPAPTAPTAPEPRSWKTEVHIPNPMRDEWATNACRFATKKEAETAGIELLSRWIVPDDSRAAPSDDPVNYKFNFDTYRTERIEPTP